MDDGAKEELGSFAEEEPDGLTEELDGLLEDFAIEDDRTDEDLMLEEGRAKVEVLVDDVVLQDDLITGCLQQSPKVSWHPS